MTNSPPVCDYEGSDYQTSFWDSGSRQYEDEVEGAALRRLLPRSGNLLLELGAGAGRNTPRYGGFNRVVLLDYSRTQLQQARKRLGEDQRYLYVAANIYDLPFAPGRFDAATMIRTLHHMADAPRALREVRATLLPGAVFLLEYANKRNIKSILRWALRRQTWNPFDRTPVEFAALNFDFHPAAIAEWLEASDFAIRRTITVSHFRIALLKRLIPTSLLVTMDDLAGLTGNLWQLTPSVFIRAEAVGAQVQPADPAAFFRCPACKSLDLVVGPESVDCADCERRWPVRDGIYDFKEAL